MQNRETGKTYKKSPMGGTAKPNVKETVYNKGVNYVPTENEAREEQALDKLITAYNSKAYANPSAPMMEKFDLTTDVYPYSHATGVNLMGRGAEDLSGRLAFANRWVKPDSVSYNAGVDLGNPNRGVGEVGVTTPLGRLSRGFEDYTDYVSYDRMNGENAPGFDAWYMNSNFMDNPIDISAHYGRNDDGTNSLYAFAGYPATQTYYNQVNTPLGTLGYGSNAQTDLNNGNVYADFTPNDYLQALSNLLNR